MQGDEVLVSRREHRRLLERLLSACSSPGGYGVEVCTSWATLQLHLHPGLVLG